MSIEGARQRAARIADEAEADRDVPFNLHEWSATIAAAEGIDVQEAEELLRAEVRKRDIDIQKTAL
jgi:hypothetical protein